MLVAAIGTVGLGMDQDGIGLDRVFGVGDDREVCVDYLDQFECRFGNLFGFGGHGGDFVALAAHAAHLQREVVAGDADRTLIRDVCGGDDHVHPRQGSGRRGVDGLDQGMDAARAQDLAVQLARQVDVMDVARPAAGLLGRIHLRDALADQRIGFDDTGFLLCDGHGMLLYSAAPQATTASTIFL